MRVELLGLCEQLDIVFHCAIYNFWYTFKEAYCSIIKITGTGDLLLMRMVIVSQNYLPMQLLFSPLLFLNNIIHPKNTFS